MKDDHIEKDESKKGANSSTIANVANERVDSDLRTLDDEVRHKLANLRRIHEQINSQWEKMPEMYHKIFGHTRFISARGWYISANVIRDIPMNELVDFFREENVEKFEKFLIDLADSVIPRIMQRCAVRFPDRAEVFQEIEKLYQLKFYRAVILLCYTQVDGMSNDFWGFGFFDKDRAQDYALKPYLKLQDLDRGINSGFADQLAISLNEITVNSADGMFTSDPTLRTRTFNRHHIIHGHSINYGTKVNATRAIYLLDFFCYWTNDKGKSIYED